MPIQRSLSCVLLSLIVCFPVSAVAQRTRPQAVRNSEFLVPDSVRGRVGFWIDVFSKYGKYQVVFHHRQSPNITFAVLDLSREGASMSEANFERFKKNRVKQEVNAIEQALRNLAKGRPPSNSLETHIKQVMAPLGRTTAKYKKVLSEDWIRSQTGIRERYQDAVVRSGRYIHILEDIFTREFGLPIELTRLPFVESSFDYKAYSSVGAAGIWQFMRSTGKAYGLRIDSYVDERRDIIAATRASASYMKDAYQRLGTWPLAVTSYNHGVSGVARKVRDMGTRDLIAMIEHPSKQPFGFASQNFYPEFLAALEIYENLPKYFPGVRLEPPLRLALRKLEGSVRVSHVVDQIGVSIDELASTNYALSSRVLSGRSPIPSGYVLKVPIAYRERLAQLRPDSAARGAVVAASSVYGGTVYRVRRGDALGSIARRYHTSVSDLREWNDLRSDTIRVGQTLVVRAPSGLANSSRGASSSSAGNIGEKSYTVRSGDSLFVIARKYRTTVSELKKRNGLRSSRIQVGQTIRVPAALPASTTSSSSELVKYRVQSGDSLWTIARANNTTVARIKDLNKLSGSSLRAGQILVVPQ